MIQGVELHNIHKMITLLQSGRIPALQEES